MKAPGFLVVAVHRMSHTVQDNYNYALIQVSVLVNIRSVGRFFLFIAGGLVAIIVGSFMIRGTMHMWDKPDSEDSNAENND